MSHATGSDHPIARRAFPDTPATRAHAARLDAAVTARNALWADPWRGPKEYAEAGTPWAAYWDRVRAADAEFNAAYAAQYAP